MDIGQEILDLLKGPLNDAGLELASDATDLKKYIGQRALHLSSIINDPGFNLALEAEADNVALRVSTLLVRQADASDARIVGILEGALGIVARLGGVA